jgi:pilus assembly protein CpaF
MTNGSASIGLASTTRLLQASLDPVRKAQQFLNEKFPPNRVRHKPLSILRQEARRALETFLEVEFPSLAKPDRDKTTVMAIDESISMGPLEELYRDEATTEFMVLAHNQIVGRKGDNWLPTSARFRDELAWQAYLKKLQTTGEAYVTVSQLRAAFDVRLPNGFRVVGVVPPPGLGLGPTVVFSRGAPGVTAAGTPNSFDSESSVLSIAELNRTIASANGGSSVRLGGSGIIRTSASERIPDPVPPPQTPTEILKQKVTERIVRKCAAAGVFDLKVIPRGELQKVIFASVDEYTLVENIPLAVQTKNILTLEILSGMRP